MELQPGLEIPGGGGNRWKVIRPLGKGTCCTVFQVQLIGELQQGALKVYKAGIEYEGAHHRELHILDILHKEGSHKDLVVEVLDEFVYNEHSCCVQELLDVNPRQLVTKNKGEPLSLWLIQRLTTEILWGLEMIHDAGFVHGDIKPTNLIWSPQHARLKIIDFGLSFHLQEQNIGEIQSPSYRAPETECWLNRNFQFPPSPPDDTDVEANTRGSLEKPNVASDMWSVGCCIVEMFTGTKLFNMNNRKHRLLIAEGKTDAEVLVENQIIPRSCDSSVPNASSIIQDLQTLVIRMLQSRTKDRIGVSEALAHEFLQHELEPSFLDLLLVPSCVLRLLNMVNPEDQEDQQDTQEILDDIETECAKYGIVRKIVWPKSGPAQDKVYVEFTSCDDCHQAFIKLNGRLFAGKSVITSYFPNTDFHLQNYY